MTLTVVYRCTTECHSDIHATLANYYNVCYAYDITNIPYTYSSDDSGSHSITWSSLAHSVAIDDYIRVNISSILSIDVINVCGDDNGVVFEPISTVHVNAMRTIMSNEDPYIGLSYYYGCIYLTLYKYYMDTKVHVSDTDKTIIYSVLHNYCNIEDTIGDIILEMYELWDVRRIYNNGVHTSLMVLESIMMSYANTVTSVNMFNMAKGLTICKAATTLDNDAHNILVGNAMAHILRLRYVTATNGMDHTLYTYDNGWNISESNVPLQTAIGSYRKLHDKYVTDGVLACAGITTTAYNSTLKYIDSVRHTNSCALATMRSLSVDRLESMMTEYDHKIMFNDMVYDVINNIRRQRQPHDVSINTAGYNILPYYSDSHGCSQRETIEQYHDVNTSNSTCPRLTTTVSANDNAVSTQLHEDHSKILDNLMESFFDDATVIDYIYELFARCLMGDVNDKCFWVFLGNTHAGKSKFMDLVRYAFGSYSVTLQGDFFNYRGNGASSATPQITKIVGKLIGIVQEPKRGTIDVESIKELTGDSEVNYRRLYHESSTVKVTTRFIACANDVMLNTSDPAFWGRCKVVMFNRMFVSEDEYNTKLMSGVHNMDKYRIRDIHIDDKLIVASRVFMRRIIDVYNSVKHRPMHHNDVIMEYTKTLRLRCDNMLRYIREILESDNDSYIMVIDAYTIYNAWYKNIVADNKNYMTLNRFTDLLSANGLNIVDDAIMNVRLTSESTKYIMSLCMQPRSTSLPMYSSGSVDNDVNIIGSNNNTNSISSSMSDTTVNNSSGSSNNIHDYNDSYVNMTSDNNSSSSTLGKDRYIHNTMYSYANGSTTTQYQQ